MQVREYNYEMGFAIDGIPIPDPASYSGAISDLDSEGGRAQTGLLHRKMVATKHPLKIAWDALDWTTMQTILSQIRDKDKFQFTFPCPESPGTIETITAYAGDREWDVKLIMNDTERTYVGALSFSIIEY